MAWLKKRELASITPIQKGQVDQFEFPRRQIIELLSLFDAESLLLDQDNKVIYSTDGITTLNIVREQYLINESLLMLVRATRRSGQKQESTMELPRGPIGSGTHALNVRTTLLDDDFIAILIFDDSEMRRLDSTRRDFVANISHELKTPIGALSILSEAVLGATDDPEAITRFAQRMQVESARLTNLVQEIINLSRLQDDDPLRNGRPININYAILIAIDRCRTSAEQKNIKIDYENNEFSGTILGDLEQITTALENLIENAINYSAPGTKVGIGTRIQGEILEISVTDQGIGIAQKDIERIFERFYRVDAARSRETGGTGLGLSIVKHVIQNHGGEVSVWSRENSGSTFTVRLPLWKEENKGERN